MPERRRALPVVGLFLADGGFEVAAGALLGAAAVGAAAYGYADPCVRQQQVYDMYGNVVWQPVRVC